VSYRLGRISGRALLAGAVASAFLLVGCSSEDTPDDTASESPADTEGLPAECSEWAEAPDAAEAVRTNAFVGNAIWEKVDGYIWFEASWQNTTDLVAVNVTANLRILYDGEDITDELPGQDTLAQYNPYTIEVMLPDELAADSGESYSTGEVTIDVPPSPQWAEGDESLTKLEADPQVERWCVPKKDGI